MLLVQRGLVEEGEGSEFLESSAFLQGCRVVVCDAESGAAARSPRSDPCVMRKKMPQHSGGEAGAQCDLGGRHAELQTTLGKRTTTVTPWGGWVCTEPYAVLPPPRFCALFRGARASGTCAVGCRRRWRRHPAAVSGCCCWRPPRPRRWTKRPGSSAASLKSPDPGGVLRFRSPRWWTAPRTARRTVPRWLRV